MVGAAKWLRRFEIALALLGISFVGGAFAATVHRWYFQHHQERIMFGARPPATPPAAGPASGPPGPSGAAALLPGAVAADPTALGRIEIPRVGVRAIVLDGDDDATLALAVGHVRGTARPGEPGNTVLAGHRDTFFRGLRNVRIEDLVRLDVPLGSYEYRVVSLEVVDPDAMRVLDRTDAETLTLVTCYPFHYVGPAPRRFIVRATRVRTSGVHSQ